MLLECPARSFGQILLPRYLMNCLNTFDKTVREYSIAPADGLVKFWRSKVKHQGHSRPKYVVAKAHRHREREREKRNRQSIYLQVITRNQQLLAGCQSRQTTIDACDR